MTPPMPERKQLASITRRDHNMVFGRQPGQHPIFQDQLPADPAQGHCRVGHFMPAARAALHLVPGRQGVSHAGHQQTHRSLGHNGGIDIDQIRALVEDTVPHNLLAVLGVKHADKGTGRVGGRCRWNHDHSPSQVHRGGTHNVHHSTAADGAQHLGSAVRRQLCHPLYLRGAGHPGGELKLYLGISPREAMRQLFL